MAYLSGGDTLPDDETRPAKRGAGSRPWDRHGDVPATAADRGLFWAPEAVDEVHYPTRMARRRALQAAQILDAWQPDPVLTASLLARVGDELLRLFDGTPAPPSTTVHDGEPVPRSVPLTLPVPDDVPVPAASRRSRRALRGGSAGRRGWRRSRRPVTAGEPDTGRSDSPRAAPRVVRQDDPVDDAAWFAGLKQMALADDAVEQGADDHGAPAGQPAGVAPPVPGATEEARASDAERHHVVARTIPDVRQIVPASAPRPRSTARRLVAIATAAVLVVGAGVAVALNRTDPDVTVAAGTSVAPQHAIVVAFSLSQQAANDARGPATPKKKKGAPPPVTAIEAQAGDVTGLSVLAAGGGSAQHVLVPSRLLLDVPGAGRVPVSRSLAGSPDAPGQAITDALEVRVDATWTLDSQALSTLVDRVGGVIVDVDVDVTRGAHVGAAVLVASGRHQKLAGAQAAQFAQFLGADEPEAARLARQEQVLRGVLGALPDDPATIRTVLGDLPGAPTGRTLDAVTRVVSDSRLAAVSNELASTVLPVREIDAGGAVVAYGLDDKAAAELVAGRLAGARLPVAAVGHVRVLVQNGVGAPGLGDSARSQLLAAGLRYVGGGNLPGFGQEQTVVLLRDASSANRQRGMAVAHALGLGESALRISETAPTVADIVVILGQDYVGS